MNLCKPATAILLVSVAGILYHLIVGNFHVMIWWVLVGVFGTGVFQGLCYGGIEPVAWVLMAIPVLIVCFFLAVALFASSVRINNVRKVPCNKCSRPKESCGCRKKPRCNKTRSCD